MRGARALFVGIGVVAAAIAMPCSAFAAPVQDEQHTEFPRLDVSELPDAHRRWLEEEVAYIITEAERDVFLRLGGDGQRELFIEQFWVQRDPTPGTPRNEYRDQHYERLNHANRIYGRGTSTPGWRTDRGRIYILLGEAASVSRLPDDQLVNPMEVWFYAADPRLGLPPFFYVAFYRRYGSGDYRLYSPVADGPRKLLNGAGEAAVREQLLSGRPSYGYEPLGFSGYQPGEIAAIRDVLREIDSDIANVAFSLLPSDAGFYDISPLRSELLLGQIQNIPALIMPRADWAARVLTGVTEAEVRFATLPLQATAVALLDERGVPFVHFAARSPGERLNLADYEGEYYFTLEVTAALTDAAERVVHHSQDHVQGSLEGAEAASRFRSSPFLYLDRLIAAPGRRTFDLVVENSVTREFGHASFDVEVPQPRPQRLVVSPPLLCAETRRLSGYDPFGPQFPFQLGAWMLLPAVDATFAGGDRLHVFQQLLIPAGFSEPIEIVYELGAMAGEQVREERVVVDPRSADEFGVVNQITAVDLQGLAPGDYELSVRRDADAAVSTLPIVIEERDPAAPRTFVNSQSQPPSSDPETAIELARQYNLVGRSEEAVRVLTDVLRRAPANAAAFLLQSELLISGGRYEELRALLAPRLIETPNDVALLSMMAEVEARLGRHSDAIRYYERVRRESGEVSPSVLNALAAEYYAAGQLEEADELLRRSLDADAEQPAARRLLEVVNQPRQSPQQILREVLQTGAAPRDLSIRTRLDFFPAAGSGTLMLLVFELDKNGLVFSGDPGAALPEAAAAAPPRPQTANLELFGTLTQPGAADSPAVRDFAASFEMRLDEGDAVHGATRSLGVVVPPGTYTLAWAVRDRANGSMTAAREEIEVPDYTSDKLMLTSVLACTGFAPQGDPFRNEQVYGGVRLANLLFQDDIDRTFARDATIELVFAVTGSQPDPVSQQPLLDISYRVLTGEEDQSIARFPAQTLTNPSIGQPLPLAQVEGLEPGAVYRLEIHVIDRVSGREVVQTVPFKVARDD